MKGEFSMGNTRTRFITHVLMTKRAFYYSYPRKRRAPPELESFDWIYTRNVAKGIIIVGLTDNFKLIRAESFETKENFKKRKSEFASVILPHIINRCKNWLQENQEDPSIKNRLKNQVFKNLARAEKRLAKVMKKKG